MRICLVSQEYPPGYVGGIGTQCRVKARALAALGHDVEVLTAGDGIEPSLTSRDDGGVTVHELCAPGGRFEVYRPETYWIGYSWAVLGALRELSAAAPFEVLDFPDYGAEGFAFQLDRTEEDATAVVVHLHGSLAMFSERIGWPEGGDGLHQVGMFMEDISLARADRLLAASRSIAELTSARSGVPMEQIDVVEGAVDTQLFCPPSEPRAPDGMRVLFAGNVVANKGVWTVLEAFAQIAERHPGATLAIAGRAEEPVEHELLAAARRAGVGERVSILGFVEHDRLARLYRSVDLLAVPSQYEGGLGMVYLEAMACALPLIAGAAGGAAEAVLDGETGILLHDGGAAEAAAAMDRLLGDAQLRARMGAAGRARVQERFGMQRYGAAVAESYGRALERRRRSVVTW